VGKLKMKKNITQQVKKKLLKEANVILKTYRSISKAKTPQSGEKIYHKLDKQYTAFEKSAAPYLTDDAQEHLDSIPKYDEYDDLIDDLKFMFDHNGDVN
jgi:hypothetical protein